ncbi:helix-turn-helix domain-containing protein [Amycolatopsis kentuckyensis]|uniref:helix-turn-helix domain-containing protein n=1 Tax=Amycolatopsis kentuckyensis TaxID=218823 RepID=UPI000A3993F1|nr:helix-turn-helix domain-containing protein [Amycolatopsis kentuckyensis]
METQRGQDRAHGCAVAEAIRELAAAVRAGAPVPPADPDALLTAEEVGELLQLSPRTLKDQAAAGVLPHHRFGKHYRFTRGDVAEIVRLSAAGEAAAAAGVRCGRCPGLPRRVRRAEQQRRRGVKNGLRPGRARDG